MLTDLSNINTVDFYLTLLIIAVVVALIVLLLRTGKSVRQTQLHAEEFAGEVKEGHGGMPLFLWVLFFFILVWSIIYFVRHASEFGIIFSP